ncbi:glycosyltransferase-like domain-containing protein 1 isoform X1 [Alosa sapidissima]|uniref:glycosyltransferase-like domain-containing protein 1 isoform X1 n=2 Tax=Alosa sapidissima TaxID=34773 RepID=UPI001C093C0A|nr:glycosyltransferase-like domain-containing protein 1 isoform X1 [Alosa sapidissima]
MSVLLIEAFYGGSHKQLVDMLHENIEDSAVYTLPAKKWHWRARTSALYFMQNIPESPSYRVLLASSVLNLAELVALRPDLGRLRKVLYFHENQLIYPVRKAQERDFQYGYNQVLSCLVADSVLFNSTFNMESFLTSMSSFFKAIPDHRPKDLDCLIRSKCQVLHFPIRFPDVTRFLPEHKLRRRATGSHMSCATGVPQDISSHGHLSVPASSSSEVSSTSEEGPVPSEQQGAVLTQEPQRVTADQQPPSCPPQGSHTGPQPQPPLHIVWPHRWEHDKDPELFFRTLLKLKERGLRFQVSVLGETFTDVPDIFTEARRDLGDRVLHWGFMPSKEAYLAVLCSADVVISTAKHEFFGVAMLEAVHCGCYPLCPKALVYPEIFPAEYLYSTPEQLGKRLQGFCKRPDVVRRHAVKVDTGLYSWEALRDRFRSVLSAEGHSVTEQAQARAGAEGSSARGSPSLEPTGVR